MILKYMGKKEWVIAALCFLCIIIQIYFDLRIPEYMSDMTEVIAAGESSDKVIGYGTDMLVCAAGSMIVSLGGSAFATLSAVSLCRHLRTRIFRRVCEFSPEDVSKFSVESLITRCSNDLIQVQNFLSQAMQVVIKAPLLSAWALVKISGAEWEWTAATAAGVLILVIIISAVIYLTRPYYKRVPILTDRLNQASLDHMTGVRAVRAYNAERFQEQKFKEASDDMMWNSIHIWNHASLMPAVSSGMNNFLTLVIFWTGITLIAASSGSSHNVVLFSNMIVFTSYASQIIGAFMSLSFLIQQSTRALASTKRVQEIVDYEPVISDGRFNGDGPEPGTVEFNHVDFTYPGSKVPALTDVSFKVGRGQTMAVIGATGSGKSTLVRLILRRYYATGGTVSVDGTDVREYKGRELESRISYVPQNIVILTGSIAENVDLGAENGGHSKEEIERALDIAQAGDFVSELPGGLDFEVTEGGGNLSGGQKQRISIARAVCKGADIMLLDDPFSALDFATDKKLRAALNEGCPGVTRILVTQRVGTVMDADLILVLDEGQVVGFGRHEDLLRECSIYREIATSQMVEGTI